MCLFIINRSILLLQRPFGGENDDTSIGGFGDDISDTITIDPTDTSTININPISAGDLDDATNLHTPTDSVAITTPSPSIDYNDYYDFKPVRYYRNTNMC